ncbi:patatin-like phospholipase family protein [Planctomonas sp. JC2975]|uniref:patatin-like phospholipase family protein n=1 Tax=Planctomonas sp. JC2975 TaxID=2729626 RepID=UPI001474A6BA|nr:patatin-like phospholipase family protein [Planctomonas sp. JC2975]NNC12454.1 patatin-like phospholipase family protein [Planctomonas sp. JC2975]
MVNDPTLGLALSGGGAFGAAHIGVLEELAARGLDPGVVAGTSSGALVGAAFAAGIGLSEIARGAAAFRWRDIAGFSLRPRWGLLDSDVLGVNLRRILGEDPSIENLERRFGAVATDLRTRRVVVLDRGPLSTALRASIAVPAILAPISRDGMLLADGGLVDNVPVSATKQLGATRTIVVKLHAKWENVRMMRSTALVEDSSVILIQPDMARMAQWTMSDVPRLIEEGRRAAAAALDATEAQDESATTA